MMTRPLFKALFLGILLSLFSAAAMPAYAQYPGFSDPGSRQSGGSGGGGLSPVTPTVDGGAIPIGATAQVVVRFRNDGSLPVETGLIRLYPSSNVTATVALNQCEEQPLDSGAECAIAISILGVQAGAWRVEMLMSHSGRTRLVTTTMSGQVEASGDKTDTKNSDVEAVPPALDFGTLSDSQTLVQPVTLRNKTSSVIKLSDIYIDTSEQAGYSLKTDCKELAAGQSCIAVVSWSPQLSGRSSGVLVVKHSGPTALTSVPLSGQYTPADVAEAQIFPKAVPGKGLLVASLKDIDFGKDVQTASTMTVSLVNTGDAALTINDIQISGSDNGLSFKEGGCKPGKVLDPIEACPLTVSWSPTRVGPVLDDVQVSHSGARGVLILPVRGEATATVSQDQKAINLSGDMQVMDMDVHQIDSQLQGGASPASVVPVIPNPESVLDGYKITSFSPSRAIISGPGGSRLVFHNEEVVLGGVPWYVVIQKNGIEFLHKGKRILLLFDRSLSSINRLPSSSGGGAMASPEASATSGSTASTAAKP